MKDCAHKDFITKVAVNRLEDSGKFSADIRIFCTECDLPFCFRGLPMGLNLNGAAMSVDGQEARLAIYPSDEDPPTSEGLSGFGIRKQC